MDKAQLEQLRVQYHDYFSIEQSVLANIRPLSQSLPDEQEFLQMIPEPFLMASEQAVLDRSALKALSKLGELAEELAAYLKTQAKKLDMMMRYVLMQQDDANYRQHTHSFGGSALNFISTAPLPEGQTLEVKLFLTGADGAVYFLATVLENEVYQSAEPDIEVSAIAAQHQPSATQSPAYLVRAAVSRIRDEDREVLVRATLHEQSRQLKRKAQEREQQRTLEGKR
ncbi:PilZ domain-containing protein [Rheinheimera sp. 4Y26]|uniref:PilZ domain-containing protein n=1 Tax=Rheinheimera sp. 4Y26 TaxID=2977811 RepID=UPI0021B13576|nr:PilZ domain-containing protein [Rheinheimera sp. 4Y26]MCT6699702.1 PilZ domain-containing protein [Rheinheimera sp. 4Y26]